MNIFRKAAAVLGTAAAAAALSIAVAQPAAAHTVIQPYCNSYSDSTTLPLPTVQLSAGEGIYVYGQAVDGSGQVLAQSGTFFTNNGDPNWHDLDSRTYGPGYPAVTMYGAGLVRYFLYAQTPGTTTWTQYTVLDPRDGDVWCAAA